MIRSKEADIPGVIGAPVDEASHRLQETVLFVYDRVRGGMDTSRVFQVKGRPQNHSSRDARVIGVDNHHRSRHGNAKTPTRGSRRG